MAGFTYREIERGLRRSGWVPARHGKRHDVYAHPTKPGQITLPRHWTQQAKPGTLADILAVAGLTEEELRRLI
jgi:predicted RNA binding protein YcfA (HicA-like mRNA interferase family)